MNTRLSFISQIPPHALCNKDLGRLKNSMLILLSFSPPTHTKLQRLRGFPFKINMQVLVAILLLSVLVCRVFYFSVIIYLVVMNTLMKKEKIVAAL